MKQVYYRLNGDFFSLSTFDFTLRVSGKPWVLHGNPGAGTLAMLEQLRRENPDVEFIRDSTQAKLGEPFNPGTSN